MKNRVCSVYICTHGVMASENSDMHHRNKLHYTVDFNRKQLFKIAIIFDNITVFLVK